MPPSSSTKQKPPRPHRVALLTFDGLQILDVTGPASVFAAANDAIGKPHYAVHIVSENGGLIKSNSAVTIDTEAITHASSDAFDTFDTVLVVGGEVKAVRALAANPRVAAWMRRVSAKAARYGSVCTGAFALAAYGLIDGKRVATHWSDCSELARLFPRLEVDTNALYVEDGCVWTSAGVTTGIDMCLEIVARDLGADVANTIAERLVLYAKRPGYQSQFSPVLIAQTRADAPFAKLIDWMKDHLTDVLDVPRLAAWVAMSERNFHRKFTAALRETPARFVETLRLDQVRLLLATGASLKEIASRTGYTTSAQLSKAFERRFGMAPLLFRQIHCAG